MESEFSTGAKITIVAVLITVVVGFVVFATSYYLGTTDAQVRDFEKNASKPKETILASFDNDTVSGQLIRELVLKEKGSLDESFTTVVKNGEHTYCYGKGVQVLEDLRPKYFKGEQRGNSCTIPGFTNTSYQSHLKPFNDYMHVGYVSPGGVYKSHLIYDQGGNVIGVVLIQL